MIKLIDTLQTFGSTSLELLWWPILIWSVSALLFRLILNLKSIDSIKLQYLARINLILTLPVAMVLVIINKYILPHISIGGHEITGYITISLAEINVFAGPNISGINSEIYTIVGIITLSILAISLFMVTNLLYRLFELKNYYGELPKKPIESLENLNSNTKNIIEDIDRKIFVSYSDSVKSPFTFGWKEPICVLPTHVKSSTPSKLNMVVGHELIHIKNNDYLLNIMALMLARFLWFHPFINYLYKEFGEQRELLCDELVLLDTSLSRKEYATLLYEYATNQPVLDSYLMIMMATKPSKLKNRIMKLNNTNTHNKYNGLKLSILLIMAVGIIGATACTEFGNDKLNKTDAPPPPTPPSIEKSMLPPPPPTDFPTEDDVFVVVEHMPELKGGLAGLQSDVKYPEAAINAGIEGRVTIQFIVNEQGDVENARVIRGIGGGCDEEALRVVQNAKFTPGVQRGQNVKVQYSLPIVFRLQ